MTDKYISTLVRGTLYVLASRDTRPEIHFHKDIGVIVDDAIRNHLEAEAIDSVRGEVDPDTGAYEIVHKAKFAFDPYDGPLSIGDRAEAVVKPRKQNVQPAKAPKSRRKQVEEA